MNEKHVFGPLRCHFEPLRCKRIDLEIYGIDHFRPSYVGLIFVNDDTVNFDNAGEDRPGYIGRFSMFAHDRCYGDVGHCSIKPDRRFDTRRSDALVPAFKRIPVTKGLKPILEQTDELTLTIIVSDGGRTEQMEDEAPEFDRLFSCSGLQLVAFA